MFYFIHLRAGEVGAETKTIHEITQNVTLGSETSPALMNQPTVNDFRPLQDVVVGMLSRTEA